MNTSAKLLTEYEVKAIAQEVVQNFIMLMFRHKWKPTLYGTLDKPVQDGYTELGAVTLWRVINQLTEYYYHREKIMGGYPKHDVIENTDVLRLLAKEQGHEKDHCYWWWSHLASKEGNHLTYPEFLEKYENQ